MKRLSAAAPEGGLSNSLSKFHASLHRPGWAGRLQKHIQVIQMLKKREEAAALFLSESVPGNFMNENH